MSHIFSNMLLGFYHLLLLSIWTIPILSPQCLAVPTNSTLARSAFETTYKTIYEFGRGTYVENIAVRSNGDLVVVLLSKPEVYSISPSTGKATLVQTFKGQSRVTGIVEVSPDIFAVIVGKLVLNAIPSSWSVWTLDLSRGPSSATATQIAKQVKGSGMLNGLQLLNPTSLLASDTLAGKAFRIDLTTGASEAVLGTSQNQIPLIGTGLNGIRLRGSMLYYSNTLSGIARIPISLQTGKPAGEAEILSNKLGFDDFAISPGGDALYAANQRTHELLKIDLKGQSKPVPIAGGSKAGRGGLYGPTSAVFGRTPGFENTIFVTTAGQALMGGNAAPDAGHAGRVVAVTLS